MFIKKLNIINFGKISDLSLEFQKGLNVIYASNESGKSSLFSFVKYILYGTKQKKLHGDLSFRERYMPWNGLPMSGSMELETSNGNFLIQRTDSERSNKLVITDISKNEVISGVASPGAKFFGFGERSFCDSCFISDVRSVNDAKSDGELVSLFSFDGNDETTYNHIKNDLMERLSLLSSSKRKSSKLASAKVRLDDSRDKLRYINECIKQTNLKLEKLYHDQIELNRLKSENDNLKIKQHKDYIDKLKSESSELVLKKNKLLEELDFIKAKDDVAITDEERNILSDNFLNLKESIRHQSVVKKTSVFLFVAALFMSLTFGIFVIQNIYNLIPMILFILLSFIQGYKSCKISKDINDLECRLNNYKIQKNNIMKKYNLNSMDECLLFLMNNQANNSFSNPEKKIFIEEQIENIDYKLKEINKIIDGENLPHTIWSDIKFFTNHDINVIINENEKNISSLMESVNRNLHYKDELLSLEDDAKSVSNEINFIEEEINSYQKEAEVINTALAILDNSYSSARDSVFPDLSLKTYEIFSYIIGECYESLITDDEFNISVNKDGFLHSAKYLSTGTLDILYFSLRIAIIDIMAQKGTKVPVFLDDVFSNCDDTRTYKILDLLLELSQNNQIFLCTCRGREGDYFNDRSDVNIIKL